MSSDAAEALASNELTETEIQLAEIAQKHTSRVAENMSGLGMALMDFNGSIQPVATQELTMQPTGFDPDLKEIFNAAATSPQPVSRLLLQNQAILAQIMRNTMPDKNGDVTVTTGEE